MCQVWYLFWSEFIIYLIICLVYYNPKGNYEIYLNRIHVDVVKISGQLFH